MLSITVCKTDVVTQPEFFTGIFKSGYSLDFSIEQTVTTIARKLNFSGFGRNFSSFSQTSVLQTVISNTSSATVIG
jgi:hypothetical protein